MTQWKVTAAVRSGRGRVRAENQDAFYCNGRFPQISDINRETGFSEVYFADRLLFAVCDGLGGYENGARAAVLAVSRMQTLQERLGKEDFPMALSGWVREISGEISDWGGRGGCTMAMLYTADGQVRAAHIGDSRVYRFHGGRLTQLTKDHSKAQILVGAGIITAEEARTHPQRHVITRYLGMDESEAGPCAATAEEALPAENRDRYLICSDGVTDMLADEIIAACLADGADADACAEQLYRAALAAGGKDNTTLIVAELETEEKEPADGGSPGKRDERADQTGSVQQG